MHCKGEFGGLIMINGKVEAETVSVFLNGNSLSVRRGGDSRVSRKELTVSPFNQYMLFTQDPKKMSGGFFYEISGTRVGGYSEGPLGHPGDGEFDYRPLRSFRLDVKYHASGITTALSGKTDEGTSPYNDKLVLEPWEFVIRFDIPKTNMQEFFQFGDSVREYVHKLFDEYCKNA